MVDSFGMDWLALIRAFDLVFSSFRVLSKQSSESGTVDKDLLVWKKERVASFIVDFSKKRTTSLNLYLGQR